MALRKSPYLISTPSTGVDRQVGEVDAGRDVADHRHHDVVDERRDDRREGGADDHADGEIERVAPHREFLEFLPHGIDRSLERAGSVLRRQSFKPSGSRQNGTFTLIDGRLRHICVAVLACL